MCIDSGVAEVARLARTITTWRSEFLAYFSAGRISNGPTEAVNLLIPVKKLLTPQVRRVSDTRCWTLAWPGRSRLWSPRLSISQSAGWLFGGGC